MGYRSLADVSATWSGRASSSRSIRRSTRTWRRPRSSGGSTRRGGRRSIPPRQGDGVPDGGQPVRHARAGPVPVPRHARGGPPAGRAEGRPGAALRGGPGGTAGVPADALRAPAQGPRAGRSWRTRRRSTACPRSSRGRRDGGPFITLPQVYTEDPDRPGLARVEPGHVPGPALGQRVRAGPGGRACTTRSTGASASTTPRPSAGASRSGSTCSWAARPP